MATSKRKEVPKGRSTRMVRSAATAVKRLKNIKRQKKRKEKMKSKTRINQLPSQVYKKKSRNVAAKPFVSEHVRTFDSYCSRIPPIIRQDERRRVRQFKEEYARIKVDLAYQIKIGLDNVTTHPENLNSSLANIFEEERNVVERFKLYAKGLLKSYKENNCTQMGFEDLNSKALRRVYRKQCLMASQMVLLQNERKQMKKCDLESQQAEIVLQKRLRKQNIQDERIRRYETELMSSEDILSTEFNEYLKQQEDTILRMKQESEARISREEQMLMQLEENQTRMVLEDNRSYHMRDVWKEQKRLELKRELLSLEQMRRTEEMQIMTQSEFDRRREEAVESFWVEQLHARGEKQQVGVRIRNHLDTQLRRKLNVQLLYVEYIIPRKETKNQIKFHIQFGKEVFYSEPCELTKEYNSRHHQKLDIEFNFGEEDSLNRSGRQPPLKILLFLQGASGWKECGKCLLNSAEIENIYYSGKPNLLQLAPNYSDNESKDNGWIPEYLNRKQYFDNITQNHFDEYQTKYLESFQITREMKKIRSRWERRHWIDWSLEISGIRELETAKTRRNSRKSFIMKRRKDSKIVPPIHETKEFFADIIFNNTVARECVNISSFLCQRENVQINFQAPTIRRFTGNEEITILLYERKRNQEYVQCGKVQCFGGTGFGLENSSFSWFPLSDNENMRPVLLEIQLNITPVKSKSKQRNSVLEWASYIMKESGREYQVNNLTQEIRIHRESCLDEKTVLDTKLPEHIQDKNTQSSILEATIYLQRFYRRKRNRALTDTFELYHAWTKLWCSRTSSYYYYNNYTEIIEWDAPKGKIGATLWEKSSLLVTSTVIIQCFIRQHQARKRSRQTAAKIHGSLSSNDWMIYFDTRLNWCYHSCLSSDEILWYNPDGPIESETINQHIENEKRNKNVRELKFHIKSLETRSLSSKRVAAKNIRIGYLLFKLGRSNEAAAYLQDEKLSEFPNLAMSSLSPYMIHSIRAKVLYDLWLMESCSSLSRMQQRSLMRRPILLSESIRSWEFVRKNSKEILSPEMCICQADSLAATGDFESALRTLQVGLEDNQIQLEVCIYSNKKKKESGIKKKKREEGDKKARELNIGVCRILASISAMQILLGRVQESIEYSMNLLKRSKVFKADEEERYFCITDASVLFQLSYLYGAGKSHPTLEESRKSAFESYKALPNSIQQSGDVTKWLEDPYVWRDYARRYSASNARVYSEIAFRESLKRGANLTVDDWSFLGINSMALSNLEYSTYAVQSAFFLQLGKETPEASVLWRYEFYTQEGITRRINRIQAANIGRLRCLRFNRYIRTSFKNMETFVKFNRTYRMLRKKSVNRDFYDPAIRAWKKFVREARLNKDCSASMMQKVFRGKRDRMRVQRIRNKDEEIERLKKRNISRILQRTLVKCMTAWKSCTDRSMKIKHLMKRVVKKLLPYFDAWKKYWEERRELKIKSAKIIQYAYHSYNDKKLFKKKMQRLRRFKRAEERNKVLLMSVLQSQAARRVQLTFRNYVDSFSEYKSLYQKYKLSPRLVEDKTETKGRRILATINSNKWKLKDEGATTIQSVFRMFSAVRKLSLARHAAVQIQKNIRRYLVREIFKLKFMEELQRSTWNWMLNGKGAQPRWKDPGIVPLKKIDISKQRVRRTNKTKRITPLIHQKRKQGNSHNTRFPVIGVSNTRANYVIPQIIMKKPNKRKHGTQRSWHKTQSDSRVEINESSDCFQSSSSNNINIKSNSFDRHNDTCTHVDLPPLQLSRLPRRT